MKNSDIIFTLATIFSFLLISIFFILFNKKDNKNINLNTKDSTLFRAKHFTYNAKINEEYTSVYINIVKLPIGYIKRDTVLYKDSIPCVLLDSIKN